MILNDLEGHFVLKSVLGLACHGFVYSGSQTKLFGNKQRYAYTVSGKNVALGL